MRSNKYLILALVFAVFNMIAVFGIFGPQKYGDSGEYIALIQWWQGDNVEIPLFRITRPLGSFFALPFEFLGVGAGLVVQNIIFYLLCVFLIFKIVRMVFHDERQAFLAALFFMTATPVIESGLAYLTDSGAWFFYLLSIFLTLLYFKKRENWLITVNALASGLAVLMKENGGLGISFFILMILLSGEFSAKEKIKKIIHFTAIFIIPIAAFQFFIYQYFHYTSKDFYSAVVDNFRREGPLLSLLRYLGQFFRILGILWIFIFIGLWREWREKNPERIKIYLSLIPASFSFFLWPTAAGARAVFIFAPLGILLASYACKKIKPLMMILIVLAVLAFNYYFVWLNPKYQFVDIIAKFLGIF